MENGTITEPAYDETGHRTDDSGQPVHIDVDPVIPTGTCVFCASVPLESAG